jgi:hypothetical protein
MNQIELDDFCLDGQLGELIEATRSTDEWLDLINPRETQHADLIAWAFDAGEGHGQSDAVFKDFLISLYEVAVKQISMGKLDQSSVTAKFVSHWKPARVLASDFASLVVFREYTVATGGAKPRPDFIIVDPANELLVVLEIKAGASFGKNQLKSYRTAVAAQLTTQAPFSKFRMAYVALDWNLDLDDLPASFDDHWAAMTYQWMESAAGRADRSVGLGNKSATLVAAYLRWMVSSETAHQQLIRQLARSLAVRHPKVIDALKVAVLQANDLKQWTPKALAGSKPQELLFRLYLQYRRALDHLMTDSPLTLLLSGLAGNWPAFNKDPNRVESALVWHEHCLPIAAHPQLPVSASGKWPLYMRLRHLNKGASGEPEFSIALIWFLEAKGNPVLDRAAQKLREEFQCKGLSEPKKVRRTVYEQQATGVAAAEKLANALLRRVEKLKLC